MKIPDSRSASRYPDWPHGKNYDPVEPAEPGETHAWLYSAHPQSKQWILAQPSTAFLTDGAYVEAACGTSLRVIYRMAFDTAKAEVCQRCAQMAQLWHDNPAEYRRLVTERHQRRADKEQREYEDIDVRDYLRQESYGTDPIDD